jgi:hypothetical protein
VPLPRAVGSLFRFLQRTTGARDGVLLVRSYDPQRDPAEVCRAYDSGGAAVEAELVPFARSVAGAVLSLQRPHVLHAVEATGSAELQPFERGRSCLLAVPVSVAPGVQAVLELFDKPGGFTEDDQRLAEAVADFGAELLRHALAERQTHQTLFDAVAAALGATDSVAQSLQETTAGRRDSPPPAAVLRELREGLSANPTAAVGAEETLRLAEAVRVLALRHGPAAVRHCTRLVEDLRELLDSVTAG